MCARDGRRLVLGLGVEDEDARAAREVREQPFEARGLVARQDDDGEIGGVQRRTSAPSAVPARSRARSSAAPIQSR